MYKLNQINQLATTEGEYYSDTIAKHCIMPEHTLNTLLMSCLPLSTGLDICSAIL